MVQDCITIVSGLPRSGTSMMMRMLEAGGMEVVQDHVRLADPDNPRGYFEYEIVKKIKTDVSWLPGAVGKVFKMVSMLLLHLPGTYRYKIIFMQRDMQEVLASQRKMLERTGQPASPEGDAQMAQLFAKHLAQVETWLGARDGVEVLTVEYGEVIRDARGQAERIAQFLGRPLDVDAMAVAVEPSLYRNRAASGGGVRGPA